MKAIRTMAVIGILLPIGMGMYGVGMHFIPMADLRWEALLVAIAYCAILTAVAVRIHRKRTSQDSYDEWWPAKLALGFVMISYCSYISLYVTAPALLTEAIGVSANKEFVIEGVEKLSAKARGCPYRLSLEGVTTVFVDSFCVSEAFALQHSAGQSIELTGKQSRFGFRFANVN